MISGVVLTKNEEKNILKCLKGLEFCDEIIIVDDFSTDKTLKKIHLKKNGIKVFKRKLDNNFALQRNFGLSKTKGEWVLFVDADEVVDSNLKKEILSVVKNTNKIGFYIKRIDYFLGKEMKHGETGNVKLLRLARKKAGKWKRSVHEFWDVNGEVDELKNPLLHFHNLTIHKFVENINFYSKIHAEELSLEGKKVNMIKVFVWPIGKFVNNYFFKFGFLDGTPGLIMAFLMSFHSFLAWSSLWIG